MAKKGRDRKPTVHTSFGTQLAIIQALEKGERQRDVAIKFNLTASTVFRIYSNRDDLQARLLAHPDYRAKPGRKYRRLEERIIRWYQRKDFKRTDVKYLIAKVTNRATRLATRLKLVPFEATREWALAFLNRHGLLSDTSTDNGQAASNTRVEAGDSKAKLSDESSQSDSLKKSRNVATPSRTPDETTKIPQSCSPENQDCTSEPKKSNSSKHEPTRRSNRKSTAEKSILRQSPSNGRKNAPRRKKNILEQSKQVGERNQSGSQKTLNFTPCRTLRSNTPQANQQIVPIGSQDLQSNQSPLTMSSEKRNSPTSNKTSKEADDKALIEYKMSPTLSKSTTPNKEKNDDAAPIEKSKSSLPKQEENTKRPRRSISKTKIPTPQNPQYRRVLRSSKKDRTPTDDTSLHLPNFQSPAEEQRICNPSSTFKNMKESSVSPPLFSESSVKPRDLDGGCESKLLRAALVATSKVKLCPQSGQTAQPNSPSPNPGGDTEHQSFEPKDDTNSRIPKFANSTPKSRNTPKSSMLNTKPIRLRNNRKRTITKNRVSTKPATQSDEAVTTSEEASSSEAQLVLYDSAKGGDQGAGYNYRFSEELADPDTVIVYLREETEDRRVILHIEDGESLGKEWTTLIDQMDTLRLRLDD